MFIELTDHLRCPVDHVEAYLVLIPSEIIERDVRQGMLGCPICHREYPVRDGVALFGEPPPIVGRPDAAPLDPSALVALLGIDGPGGYAVFVGSAADQVRAVAEILRGVHIVAVNSGGPIGQSLAVSALEAGSLPLKSRSMRGVALGRGYGGDQVWHQEAWRVALPGLRVIGEGAEPAIDGLEILASAGGWWVGRKV